MELKEGDIIVDGSGAEYIVSEALATRATLVRRDATRDPSLSDYERDIDVRQLAQEFKKK